LGESVFLFLWKVAKDQATWIGNLGDDLNLLGGRGGGVKCN